MVGETYVRTLTGSETDVGTLTRRELGRKTLTGRETDVGTLSYTLSYIESLLRYG